MLKYLLVLLMVWLLWRALRASRRRLARKPAKAQSMPQDMVQCARCGIYLPRGNALADSSDASRCYCRHHAPANQTDYPS